MALTGADIVTAALGRANVASENLGATKILLLLNEVLGNYYRDLGGLDATFQPSLAAGTQEYAFEPAGIAEVDELRMVRWKPSGSSTWTPLIMVDQTESSFYTSTTGSPWGFYIYRPAGTLTLGLLPTPDAVGAAGTVQALYRYTPTDLTATTDTIPLPQSARSAVINSLAARFAEEDNNDAKADRLDAKAEDQANRAAENLIEQSIVEIQSIAGGGILRTGGDLGRPGPGWYPPNPL